MSKTTPENLAKIDTMVDAVMNTACNLYSRWLDEKDYEDINDYLAVIQKNNPVDEIIISKMNKRPFGFNFSFGGTEQYQFYIKANTAGWKRTA